MVPRLRAPAALLALAASVMLARADDGLSDVEAVSHWSYYNNMGWKAFAEGNLDVAEFRFSRAVQVVRPYGKEHPGLLARSYHDLTRVLCAQKRFKEAEPLARWVVEAREHDPRTRDDALFDAVYLLAVIERQLGRDAEAVPILLKAVAIEERNLGPSSPQLALTIKELADAEAMSGSYPEAEGHYARAVGIHEKADAETADLAEALEGRAAILATLGREDEARAAAERAAGVRERLARGVKPAAR